MLFSDTNINDYAIPLQRKGNWNKNSPLSTCHICTEGTLCLHGKKSYHQKPVKLSVYARKDIKNSCYCLRINRKSLKICKSLQYLLNISEIDCNKVLTNSQWLYIM